MGSILQSFLYVLCTVKVFKTHKSTKNLIYLEKINPDNIHNYFYIY